MHAISKSPQLIFLILLFQNVVNSQFEGELCFHKKKGVNGICKLLDQCPDAVRDLQMSRIYPQHCAFKGFKVIACCPQVFAPPIITTTTTITKPKPTSPLPVGEKCKRACESFVRLAYKKEISPVLSTDEDYVWVENCPWEAEAQTGIDTEYATKGEFPHMALIGYGTPENYAWKCGGSLISERFVLTAAHCLFARDFGEPKFVRLGELDHSKPNDDQHVQQINIQKLYKHPEYKFPSQYNDIALLQLERPAILDIYVKPACLYVNDSADEKAGVIAGWGNTENGTPSNSLLKAIVWAFTPAECNTTYGNNRRGLPSGIDPNLQLCFGSKTNEKGTCQSDSGGPIQKYANKEAYCSYYVFGITSFGKSCGNKGVAAGYVKLYPYISWIENIVWH